MLNEGSSFCDGCGARAEIEESQPQNRPYYYAPTKSVGLGILLTFLINGSGQMYAGKWERGLLVFALNCIMGIALAIMVLDHAYYDYYNNLYFDFAPVLAWMTAITVFAFVLFVFSLYDTYTLIEKYNEHVRRNGNPPW